MMLSFAEHVQAALKVEEWLAWRDAQYARRKDAAGRARRERAPKSGPCRDCGTLCDKTYHPRCGKCRTAHAKLMGWKT